MRRPGRRPGIGRSVGFWLVRAFTALVLLFLMAPALVVIPMSFAGDQMVRFPPREFSLGAYERFFQRWEWVESTLLSFQVAGAVMLLSVAIATLAAFGLALAPPRIRRPMLVMALIPVIVPTIIFAIGIYWLLAGWGLIGTASGFVLAHLVLAVPYVVLVVDAGLRGLDWSLARAAASLGAPPWQVAWRVILPLLLPAMISGGLFAFLTSFDEVVVATFISGPHAVTLPKRMWDGILYRADPAIGAISTMLIGLTLVVLVVAALAQGRRGSDVGLRGRL